ncbi:uncharacterized protein LOC115830963 [Nomascus leucogenys]|uniref:uncharacterized protein LOC115830963 n=1 Tax=Nomascus leucogenys TaxID=61853 RepID=UPI00122DA41F|nr:uncharacterized protein LOC115830963 [Nomascus leucogenys]
MFSWTFLFPNPSSRQFSKVQAPLLLCRPHFSRPSPMRSPNTRRLKSEPRRRRPTKPDNPYPRNTRRPLGSPARRPAENARVRLEGSCVKSHARPAENTAAARARRPSGEGCSGTRCGGRGRVGRAGRAGPKAAGVSGQPCSRRPPAQQMVYC